MIDTQSRIFDAAEELIQRVPVNEFSYKHISDAVGIRKASMHRHFPQNDDLVNALLRRCQEPYGSNYSAIVVRSDRDRAPEKLRNLAGVFEDELINKKLCVVGSISTDKNTLQDSSCQILESTIKSTVEIFARVFRQGREEGSIVFSDSEEDAAYAFLAFLIGTQIVARVHGGQEYFQRATGLMINTLAKA